MEDKNSENCNLHYDYANRCDCREDDNCGCSFPNNLAHDFDCLSSDDESFQQPADQICTCNQQGEHNEK